MKTRHFALAALTLALAACNNDNENLNIDGPVAAQFTAAIGDNVTATPATRVSGTDGDQWDVDDCIGITGIDTKYENIPYVTNGNGNFTPKSTIIYFDTPDDVYFFAYYPYKPTGEMTDSKIAATTDAEAQKVQTRHDFLFANGATGNTHVPQVSFASTNAFSHCMSKITLNFIAGSNVTFQQDDISYTLKGLLLEGTFDTTNGKTATTATTPTDVTLPGSLTSSIFFPQEVASISIAIALNGNTYHATLPVQDNKLQSGNEYCYDITISHNDVDVSATINKWNKVNEDGINATF